MVENTESTEPEVKLIPRKNRDPADKNSFFKVDFTDIIAEPHGFHSDKRLYKCAFDTFNCAKRCCYLFLTFLCGGPLAFFFGCYFACLGFQYIWCLVPCSQACLMRMKWIGEIVGYCTKAFCSPCYMSIGKMFSRIHVKTETV